jgi:hypothetical protein
MDVSSLSFWALRIGQGSGQHADCKTGPPLRGPFRPFLSPQAATSSGLNPQATDHTKSCHNKFARFAAVAENLVRALLTSQDQTIRLDRIFAELFDYLD